METPPLVIITWRDSRQPTNTWQWRSDIKETEALIIRSVGWLIADNETEKVLCSHWSKPESDGDQQMNGVMVIPMEAVKFVTHLPDLQDMAP